MQDLRRSVIQGAAVVAARQAASLVIGLGGTIALTRLLGPTGYGRFAAALGLYTYLFGVAQLGLNAWLVRRVAVEGEPSAYATARALLLLTGAAAVGAGVALLPLVEGWLGGVGLRPLALALFAGLPLQLMTLVPLAALERELRYRVVAVTELQGMLAMYAVSVILAARGAGPMAMVIGWWAQQLWLFVRFQRASGLPLAVAWHPVRVREGLRYGLGYAASIWTWQLKELVNPLIVGRALGMDGVAVVALAVRLVDAASFVKAATWRLALPAFARLQHDTARLGVAVRDGMRLQLLAVGPALLALVLIGQPLVPLVFGEQWMAVRALLPLIAAGTLANAAFNLHSSALYALGRPGAVTLFHLAFVLCFGGAAAVLVPMRGVTGYGFAELAALPAYVVVFAAFRARVPTGAQRDELLLAASFVMAVAGVAWSPWCAVIALLPFVRVAARAGARESYRALREGLLAKAGA